MSTDAYLSNFELQNVMQTTIFAFNDDRRLLPMVGQRVCAIYRKLVPRNCARHWESAPLVLPARWRHDSLSLALLP